jgi:hypothetical protein
VLSLAGLLVKQDFGVGEQFTHQFSRFARRLRSQKIFATFLANATAGADRSPIAHCGRVFRGGFAFVTK